jgi:hypothetical protein
MKLKNRENQKYLQKHEVKISKTITVEGNAQSYRKYRQLYITNYRIF